MRLQLQRRTELALRALRLLEDDGGTMRAVAMAPTLEASAQYLPQVLGTLVRAGWLTSEPGPTGGYRLTTNLDDHSTLELIEMFEGPSDTNTCVLNGGPCGPQERCALHAPWLEARTALTDRLSQIPISGQSKGP